MGGPIRVWPSLPHGVALTTLVVALLASGSSVAATAEVEAAIESGDRAWARRAESLEEMLAEPTRIGEAITHFRAALGADPSAIEARWKLMRALHYAIDFTTLGEEAKEARAREIVEVARESVEVLESAEAVEDFDRARVLFWTAIAWGTRAQRVGLLTIVTEGVATRMHDFARDSLALDPSVDRGGALRLLSRLHATLPRVPFVSGWVDRDEALPLAERGYALDPEHPGNRLILALALEEQGDDQAERVRELLESVADATPRPDYLVEDLAIQQQARERLAN